MEENEKTLIEEKRKDMNRNVTRAIRLSIFAIIFLVGLIWIIVLSARPYSIGKYGSNNSNGRPTGLTKIQYNSDTATNSVNLSILDELADYNLYIELFDNKTYEMWYNGKSSIGIFEVKDGNLYMCELTATGYSLPVSIGKINAYQIEVVEKSFGVELKTNLKHSGANSQKTFCIILMVSGGILVGISTTVWIYCAKKGIDSLRLFTRKRNKSDL